MRRDVASVYLLASTIPACEELTRHDSASARARERHEASLRWLPCVAHQRHAVRRGTHHFCADQDGVVICACTL